jgi:hypothetical protein
MTTVTPAEGIACRVVTDTRALRAWCALTAHTNAKLDAKLGTKNLLFGFTEFVDGDAAFGTLVNGLDARARRLGATRLLGPVNLLPNQSGGVVTSGYEQRGFVDSPYNLPYYQASYERRGFARAFEGSTFIASLDGDDTPVERIFPFDDERIQLERLEVRQANRRRIPEELVFIRSLLNASFARLGYYTTIDEDELAYQVDGLNYLLDERIALYLFKAGTPIPGALGAQHAALGARVRAGSDRARLRSAAPPRGGRPDAARLAALARGLRRGGVGGGSGRRDHSSSRRRSTSMHAGSESSARARASTRRASVPSTSSDSDEPAELRIGTAVRSRARGCSLAASIR